MSLLEVKFFSLKNELWKRCLQDDYCLSGHRLLSHDKDVYMKDINDIYMMIKHKDLDYRIIGERLAQNGLEVFASILFGFIFKNYDLAAGKKDAIQCELKLDEKYMYLYENWPFDEKEAYEIKKEDLNQRLKKGIDNARVYLQPLYVFDEKERKIEEIYDAFKQKYAEAELDDYAIIRAVRSDCVLYVCAAGIFTDVYSIENGVDRLKLKEELRECLNTLGIYTYKPAPYSMEYLASWYI